MTLVLGFKTVQNRRKKKHILYPQDSWSDLATDSLASPCTLNIYQRQILHLHRVHHDFLFFFLPSTSTWHLKFEGFFFFACRSMKISINLYPTQLLMRMKTNHTGYNSGLSRCDLVVLPGLRVCPCPLIFYGMDYIESHTFIQCLSILVVTNHVSLVFIIIWKLDLPFFLKYVKTC